MEYEIRHNPDENRFEAISNEEIIGVANYYIEEDVVIVTHTGVESKYEGQGIAGELTKNLLVYVAMNNFKVNPMCS